ncbi:MAG: MucBP domain-containing protein, partial [Erysipelotrichales bacterium]
NGEELIKIGSTTTDNTGSFAFSNYEANAGSFYINDTSNDLYIGLGDTQYKEWLVSGVDGIDVSLLNNKKLRLGKITDISKHQDVFEQAFGRTVWQDGFQNKDEAAKKATTLKYIVSDSDAPIENEKGIVDIYYQDTKGNNLSAKKVLSDRVGVAYKSNALKIENYKLKEIKGSESGTFKKEKQTIIYIYDYKKEPIKVVKKKIVKTGSEMFALSSMIIVLGLSIGVSNKRNN